MIREAFRAILLGDGQTSAAVGGSRIYPLMMPQGVRDASLVYQSAGGAPDDPTFDGPRGLRESRIQLDAWATDPDAAANLIQLAEATLGGFSGIVPYGDDSPQQRCNVRGIFREAERSGYDKDAKLFRDARDFRVLWCPAT